MPTPKQLLIEQIDDLNEKHQLDLSTAGTEAELKARYEQALASLEGKTLTGDLETGKTMLDGETPRPRILARYTLQVQNKQSEVITVKPGNEIDSDDNTLVELLEKGLAYEEARE